MTLYNVRSGGVPIDPLWAKAYPLAGKQLQEQMTAEGTMGPGGFMCVKVELTSPFFADMVFSFKNKIFAVVLARVGAGEGSSEEVASRFVIPDQARLNLVAVSAQNNLVPCVYPVKDDGCPWAAGWNLWHLESGVPLCPTKMADDQPTLMSDWELSSFANQVVREHVMGKGWAVESFHDVPGIDPQIWFKDAEGRRAWVVVRPCVYPQPGALRPANLEELSGTLKDFPGYFASVGFAPADAKDATEGNVRLVRGQGMYVAFKGLEALGFPEGGERIDETHRRN